MTQVFRSKAVPNPLSWKKQLTFAEAVSQPREVQAPELRHSAIDFYNSFEGAWLRKPFDDMRDRAAQRQASDALQLYARKLAGEQGVSVPQIMSNLTRQFERPSTDIGNPGEIDPGPARPR